MRGVMGTREELRGHEGAVGHERSCEDMRGVMGT